MARISAMRAAWMRVGIGGRAHAPRSSLSVGGISICAAKAGSSSARASTVADGGEIVVSASARAWPATSSSDLGGQDLAGFPAVEGIAVLAHQHGAVAVRSERVLKMAGAEKPRPSDSSGASATSTKTKRCCGLGQFQHALSGPARSRLPASAAGRAPLWPDQARGAPECASASCPAGRAWAPGVCVRSSV